MLGAIVIHNPLIVVFLLAFAVASTIFWTRQLVACAREEPTEERRQYLLLIIFFGIFGALLYYFKRRPQRLAEAKQALDASVS